MSIDEYYPYSPLFLVPSALHIRQYFLYSLFWLDKHITCVISMVRDNSIQKVIERYLVFCYIYNIWYNIVEVLICPDKRHLCLDWFSIQRKHACTLNNSTNICIFIQYDCPKEAMKLFIISNNTRDIWRQIYSRYNN